MNSFYSELTAKLNALMEGVPYQIANLANASALLCLATLPLIQ